MNIKKLTGLFHLVWLSGLLLSNGIPVSAQQHQDTPKLVDVNICPEAVALYHHLQQLAPDYVLYGQQDALAYGVTWKRPHRNRSDVKDVVGSHPAVMGWEVSKLGISDRNIDSVDFRRMKRWIRLGFRQGSVQTISWHLDNLLTGGDSWDVGERVVPLLLPGGRLHRLFKERLDYFAEFIKDLKTGWLAPQKIPIIFRPFHEHTGSWFWWGKDFCTPEEYKALWHFTVEYLRDVKQVHQLLYAYSTDIVSDTSEYLERYPGDTYVDIMGIDDYHDVRYGGDPEKLGARLAMLVRLANSRGKIAALTETGQEAIPDTRWWTGVLLAQLKNSPEARGISYLMTWRNARPNHHYSPYPDHPSAVDFRTFAGEALILLQDDLPDLYKIKPR